MERPLVQLDAPPGSGDHDDPAARVHQVRRLAEGGAAGGVHHDIDTAGCRGCRHGQPARRGGGNGNLLCAAAFRLLHGYQPIAAQVTSAGITDTVTGAVTPLTI